VANVYYSVGQNSTDHSSGGNVSITSGVATFDTAQVATNLGVGDRLTYGGHIGYLAVKTDTTHWTVVTALGAAVGDHASTTVDSIGHEYTSLSAAEAGASDANHINNTSLVTANVILNIPCYYDSGDDTTVVTVSGYTTGVSNYIKIYTPNNTSTEVNQSQRHAGKTATGVYRRQVGSYEQGIINDQDYTVIQGLIVYGWGSHGINTGSRDNVNVSYNIVYGFSASGGCRGIHAGYSTNVKVYNNIVYSCSQGIGLDYSGTGSLVYNNTVVKNTYGFVQNYGVGSYGTLKNNIASNTTSDYYVTGTGSFFSVTYCASDDATADDWGGAGNRIDQTFTFVNYAGNDFHLASSDAGAKDYGTDLSSIFTDDIDGETRSGTWDIGADEYVAAGETRNLLASIVGASTTPDVAATIARALLSNIGGVSSTPDISSIISRALLANIPGISTTPNISGVISRELLANLATVSTTPGISAAIAHSLLATITSESLTPNVLATLSRSLLANMQGISLTPEISITIARALMANIVAGSYTPDITATMEGIISLIANISAISTTPDIAAITARALMVSIPAQSITANIIASITRNMLANITATSMTPNITAVIENFISLAAAIAGVTFTPDVVASMARSLSSLIVAQSLTPNIVATTARSLLANIQGTTITPDDLIVTLVILGAMVDLNIESKTPKRIIESKKVKYLIHDA